MRRIEFTKKSLPKYLKYIAWMCLTLLPTCGLSTTGTEERSFADLDRRYLKYHVEYMVDEDLSFDTTIKAELKVLNQRALEKIKKQRFSYSTSMEKLSVEEAVTVKKDGNKHPVPKNNFQVKVQQGKDGNDPIFSDRTSLTIVFPEVEVGDTISYTVKKTQFEPLFPGHFSQQDYFYREVAFDDVKITFNVPAELSLQSSIRQMNKKEEHSGNRKIITLSYENKKPYRNERTDYSYWDEEEEPGYIFSTFNDYRELADAYGKRAIPKAEVTGRIQELSDRVVGEEQDKLEQARLLYEWVAKNLTYAGNCFGVGAVVPHDIDVILDNRMGDCKDHATLLQALLAAQGIESKQVLVNSGASYKLPSVPAVAAFNHVFNYLPDFDRFIDATDHRTPFTMLAFSLQDKPVFIVADRRDNVKTPVTGVGQNSGILDMDLNISQDGGASGKIQINLKGFPAVHSRSGWRHVSRDNIEKWFEEVFASDGQKGVGSILRMDDPEDLVDTFNYSLTYEKKELIQRNGAGAFRVYPLVPAGLGISGVVSYATRVVEDHPYTCSNLSLSETYRYTFPKDMQLLAVPGNMEIRDAYLHYKATYESNGRTLTVTRKLNDTTPGNVCTAELIKNQHEVALEIAKDLKSQVVYK